jgi:hypothetical protein
MEHPITPPLEFVYKWAQERVLLNDPTPLPEYIATAAAQWGADQELEACIEWFDSQSLVYHRDLEEELRTARRPKPPSRKKQALLQLDTLNADLAMHGRGCDLSQIRRALEALPND